MLKLLQKTFQKTAQNIREILPKHKKKIPKDLLEEILISTDIEYELIEMILSPLSSEVTRDELEVALLRLFRGESYYDRLTPKPISQSPCVHLIIGVNGAGKTTTLAKLAKHYQKQGKSVLFGAGDTFRAAAIEQLSLWAEKLTIPIIASKQGHDPSAVAFDTIKAALARNIDIVLLDTAGRLHNQTNLQQELQKIMRICNKACPSAPHQKILILDGTQGSSSIAQAQIFSQTLGGLDGVIVTKLDGTSKGGSIFSIIYHLRVPILFLGTGEREEDLIAFCEQDYIALLLDSIFE